jgi:hypothetical protein
MPTGSPYSGSTIGIVDVACFDAKSAGPAVTMASTLSRTNSDAISVARLLLPSAQRYSIATVRPSSHPRLRSCWTKAAVYGLQTEAEAPPKNPIVGNLPTGLGARRERPHGYRAAKRGNKFSSSDVDCHATLQQWGRYHALIAWSAVSPLALRYSP